MMSDAAATRRLGKQVMVAWVDDDGTNGDVTAPDEPLPDDVETLKALLLVHRAELRNQALLIEKLRHRIAKLQHERYGQSSERRALLDQLELQLFELEENEAQAEAAAQIDKP